MKLNLGCGADIRDGWVNLDMCPAQGVDVVHVLGSGPLPFDNATFDLIRASHVLEHVQNWEYVLHECYRVMRPGGSLEILVPYGINAIQHPYHIRFFLPQTLDEFCDLGNRPRGLQVPTEGLWAMEGVGVDRQFRSLAWLIKEVALGRRSWRFLLHSRKQIIWRLRKPIEQGIPHISEGKAILEAF